MVKLPAEELEWSRALGREGLSGLSHHKNRPEVGLQRAGRIIHHLQSEHLLLVQRLEMVDNSTSSL